MLESFVRRHRVGLMLSVNLAAFLTFGLTNAVLPVLAPLTALLSIVYLFTAALPSANTIS